MVNESAPDYFAHLQPAARDLPVPHFTRPVEIKGISRPVRAIAWSSDGRRVAVGSEYKGLRVFDCRSTIDVSNSSSLPSGSKPSPHNGHVAALAFSPVEPNTLVSGCKSSSAGAIIAIWDLTSPSAAVSTFKITGDVLHIAFHPSGTQFAVVCPRSSRDEVFFYRRTGDGWEVREDVGMGGALVDIGSEEINSLRFSNSGKLVCAVSNDGSVNAWLYPLLPRKHSPEPVAPPPSATAMLGIEDVQEEEVKSRAATPREGTPDEEGERGKDDGANDGTNDGANEDGGEATAVEEGGRVDGQEGEADVALDNAGEVDMAEEGGSKDVTMTEYEPNLSTAAHARAPTPPPPQIPLIETDSRRSKQLRRFRHSVCHSASLLSLSFDPLGRFLAVGGQDALLSLFETRDWICIRTFDVCTAAIRHSAFSPDGELLAFGGDDTFIAIVSVFSGATIAKLPVPGTVNSLCWHPRKNWLGWSTSGKIGSGGWWVVHQE